MPHRPKNTGEEPNYYTIGRNGVVRSSLSDPPAAARDRLYLVNVSGIEPFRNVYDALSGMNFYNLNPDQIRELQPPDPGALLRRDGSNIASVLANLRSRSPDLVKRIEEYLAAVVPGIAGFDRKAIGPRETLEFRQKIRGATRPRRFLASGMSDGTLRACGVLVALLQGAVAGASSRSLVGIEEPEIALHPAAAEILIDSLQEASDHTQVLVTSHSPDLLDHDAISDASVLAVVAEDGDTHIGPLDEVGRSVLHDHLYTAGELLRMDQLRPAPRPSSPGPRQLELFGPETA